MAVPSPRWIEPQSPAGPSALTYRAGGAVVIAVTGALDRSGLAGLDRAFTDAFGEGHRNLVLDLHLLRTLDAEALSVLWAALRGSIRRGGTFAAAGLHSSLRPELEPLVPHGLRLHRTVRSALAAAHDPSRVLKHGGSNPSAASPDEDGT